MTNEDFQQRAETLLNLQAQSDARLGKLEEIVTRLANASLERITNIEDTMSALADAQIKTEDTVAVLAKKMADLSEAQAHTDRRLDALIDIIREEREKKNRNGNSQT
ncbi:MAG TPA: hypothetical protein VM943_00890 [Pyrinomonadaceae bacterium]|nr:hypothetical protein [Pyrinomonadaceae bacterium]